MKNQTSQLISNCLTATALLIAILAPQSSSATIPVLTDQGGNWTATTQEKFYTQDQGSRIMPLKWISALKQANGLPFLADSLGRYGYLPNPKNTETNLPVGFTVAEENGEKIIGMNCSACHSRQIEVSGVSYRIDGGPAITDMQSFLSDLHKAVNTILNNTAAFTEFSHTVLGTTTSKQDEEKLHTAVATRFGRAHV